ncbi:hypothetical protein PQX77_008908 [Marasmius sp. AFHP31]|nr:hypothetical protein PQX77_008908 [Marasmius sp. AFHP31]
MEIREKERQLVTEGCLKSGYAVDNYDSLPYKNTVLKESMRYHPAAIRILRMAFVEHCLPLSESIKTASGKKISEIPVSKGQRVMLSIAGHNRNKEVYGEDAHIFRPERWLENEDSKKGGTLIGVYANFPTFFGGVRLCIGWRFAVLKLQTFLVELISNFEIPSGFTSLARHVHPGSLFHVEEMAIAPQSTFRPFRSAATE